MKKLIFAVAAAAAAMLALFCFAGCDEQASHEHQWGEWTLSTPATCTAEGTETRSCTECGEVDVRSVAKTEHQAVTDEARPATCLEEGLTEGSHCSVCGTVIKAQETVEKLAHTPVTEKGYEATCLTAGLTDGERCSSCGTELKAQKEIPALGHDWVVFENGTIYEHIDGTDMHRRVCKRTAADGTVYSEEFSCEYEINSREATCEAPGTTRKSCPACNYSEEKIDSVQLGHDWGDWTYDPGTDHHTRRCSHDTGASCVQTEPCHMTGDYLAPTCETPGYSRRTCDLCNREENEQLDATGHDYGEYIHTLIDGKHYHIQTCANNPLHVLQSQCTFEHDTVPPTCDTEGYTGSRCKVCHYAEERHDIKEPLGHRYETVEAVEGANYHKLVCANDPTHYLEVPCKYTTTSKTPTCTEVGYVEETCSECHGKVRISETPALGHAFGAKYSNQNGTHTARCSRCNTESSERCNYAQTVIPATCTAGGYTINKCIWCSYESERTNLTDKLGHDFKNYVHTGANASTHTAVCSRTGCSATDTEECSFLAHVTAATCTTGGYTTYSCTKCSNSYVGAPEEKLGHSWAVGWIFDESAKEHYHACTRIGCTEVERKSCEFKQTDQKDPDCYYAGYTVMTCSVCQGSYHEAGAPANGHTLGQWTQGGTEGNYYHYQTCSVCGFESDHITCVPSVVTTPAGCLTYGKVVETCDICNRVTERQTDAPRGHDFGNWESDGQGKHFHVCRRDNCSEREEENCSDHMDEESEEPTCLNPGHITKFCSKCKYTLESTQKDALQHSWDHEDYRPNGKLQHMRSCTRCGYNDIQNCSYTESVQDATCSAAGLKTETCQVCKNEIKTTIPQLEHTFSGAWTSDGKQHSNQCTRCHQTVTGVHDFENSNLCSLCKYDGLTYDYDIDNNKATVAGDDMVPGAEVIVIPSKTTKDGKEYTVTKIARYAFYRHSSITELHIPTTLTHIGDNAFTACGNLRTVTIDKANDQDVSQLKEIGYAAFQACSALSSASNLPDSLQTIGASAFAYCTSLYDFNISNSVQTIGTDAFFRTGVFSRWEQGSDSALYLGLHLIRVRASYTGTYNIEANTLSVAARAFENCIITGLKIPVSVVKFDSSAFSNCTKLENVWYDGTVNQWLAIDFVNDMSSPVHAGQAGEKALTFRFHLSDSDSSGGEPSTDITIPAKVKTIPAGTFKGDNITSVVIEDGVTEIGAEAFMNCASLASVTIPASVKKIGKDAFAGTKLLSDWQSGNEDALYLGKDDLNYHLIKVRASVTSHTIDSNTVTIGYSAFEGCSSLTELTIPASVRWVGANAFKGCTALKYFVIEGRDFLANATGMPIYRGLGASNFPAKEDADALAKTQYVLNGYLGEWERF